MTSSSSTTAPSVKTIGFISPPGWIDPTPAEFQQVCAGKVKVQQCPLPLPGFDWRIDSIAQTEPELLSAARALGDMGCSLVAKVGTPFSWAGLASIAEARARIERLAAVASVPVVMSGVAIIDAIAALGVSRVALACTYYSDDWTDKWARFVAASGIDVLSAQNLATQGLMPEHDAADRNYWQPTAEQITGSVRAIVDQAPTAQAIAISGSGSRTLGLIHALEAETGRHIIGTDTALYWAIAKSAGLDLKAEILGNLTDV